MTISVYIHMGPPKTATSAIQHWLQNNRNILLKHGIFYPDHSVDENGVSSGNVLEVFDRDKDKNLFLSNKKVQNILQDCSDNGCHTLLLSSEFFFFQVPELLKAFPNAVFIAYIRFPLDVIESSYNQSVKRHFEVKPLGLPKEPQAYHLTLLEKMLEKYSQDHFVIHLYSEKLFVNGNIISDFLSILGISHDEKIVMIINTSYSFEALELKRWLNNFLRPEHQQRIDSFLQSYSQGEMSYSLIPENKYSYYSDWFSEKLARFFSTYNVEKHQIFQDEISSKKQKTFLKQSLAPAKFERIVKAMVEYDAGLVYGLSKELDENIEMNEKMPEFSRLFKSSVPSNYKFETLFKESLLAIKYKLKKLHRIAFSPEVNTNTISLTNLARLRSVLKIEDGVSDAEVFRELALYCEQNSEINLAYRLMKEADILRPNGPVITAKLAEYQEKLNLPLAVEKARK